MQADAARAVALGLGGQARRRAAAALLVRRRHRPARGHDADVLDRGAAGQPDARCPTAGSSWRGSSTATSGWSSNIGGRPWASFGVLVRRPRASESLHHAAGPRARRRARRSSCESPHGRCAAPSLPARPYAGPFETLVARGHARPPRGGRRDDAPLRARWIETRWRSPAGMRGRYTVDVLFPAWGKARPVEAVLAGGRRVTLAGPGCRAAAVSLRERHLLLPRGRGDRLRVVPIGPAAAVARILRPGPQSSAPRPGPTLAVQLAGRGSSSGSASRSRSLRPPAAGGPLSRGACARARAAPSGRGRPRRARGPPREQLGEAPPPAGTERGHGSAPCAASPTSTSTTSGSNWPPAPSRSSLTATHGRRASR